MNREIICETAWKLFNKHGYDNVKVQDICDACEISKPTFYHYVKSKEEMIIHFYDDVTLQITNQLSSIIEADNHWEQFMICFSILLDESIRVGSDIGSQMFIMNLKNNQHSFDRRKYLTDIMVSIIRKGQQTGQILNLSDPEHLYEAAAYMFSGYEVMWCIRNGEMQWRERMFKSFETLFMVRQDLRSYS